MVRFAILALAMVPAAVFAQPAGDAAPGPASTVHAAGVYGPPAPTAEPATKPADTTAASPAATDDAQRPARHRGRHRGGGYAGAEGGIGG